MSTDDGADAVLDDKGEKDQVASPNSEVDSKKLRD